MRMQTLTFWIAIILATRILIPITTAWGQPAPDNSLNSFIIVPLLGGTLMPLNGILRRGTICGLGHTTNFPDPVCAGHTIQQHVPNGNCPPGYDLVQLCDFGASSGTNFFACVLANDTPVSTLPQGLLCGYGHTGQPAPSCQGKKIIEHHPETCPSGYVYTAYGDIGASQGQGFFGCVLAVSTPVQASDDVLPSGGVCGLSHTCGGPVGNFCGPIQIRPGANGCPAGYVLSWPVDFGASSGAGQYYCHSCSPGQKECGGTCTDLSNDRQNCGGCGKVCPDRQVCQNSTCICPAGTISCGGDTCTNVNNDRQNCGACGKVCPDEKVCQNGQCICPPGSMDCNGTCRNITSDPQNCGGCNKLCGGQACCSGTCKDLSADATNCGQCENVCPQTCSGARTCISGACQHVNQYQFLVEGSNKCPYDQSLPEQAYSADEATRCAQNTYPPPQFTVGLDFQQYVFAVSCPDVGGGSTCYEETILALTVDDAMACVQSNYGGCTVVAGHCP
jgi:Stigma-specific protein, Stig1